MIWERDAHVGCPTWLDWCGCSAGDEAATAGAATAGAAAAGVAIARLGARTEGTDAEADRPRSADEEAELITERLCSHTRDKAGQREALVYLQSIAELPGVGMLLGEGDSQVEAILFKFATCVMSVGQVRPR